MSYISISPNAALGLPLDITNPLEVSGALQHSLVVGGAAGQLISLGVAVDGGIPIGVTGGDPVLTTITAGANINIVNAPGSITISSTGGSEFADDVFRIYDNADNTSKIAFEAFPISPATTRTITMCDQDLDLTDPNFPGTVTAGTGFVATTGNVEVTAGSVNLPATNVALTAGVVNIDAIPYLHAAGADNIFAGQYAGNGTLAGAENVGIGLDSLNVATTASYNVGVGSFALSGATDGSFNTSVGSGASSSITTGNGNVSIGAQSASNITTGNYNITIGANSGLNLTAGNSNNILIGHIGFAGESNALRIGTTGGGAAQQSSCYIAATYGVTPAGAVETVVINANGQIGSTSNPVNNEFADNVFRIYDNGTNTKKLAFECSSISAATTRTITMDDRDIDMDAVPTSVVTDAGTVTPATGSFSIVGAGSISTSAAGSVVTVSGGGLIWNEVTGTSQAAAVNNGYICNNVALVTVTLPDTAALGSVLRVVGKGAGGWKIAQNAGETIYWDATTATTTGVGGSLNSIDDYDAVELVCITADTDWMVLSAKGNILVV